MSDVKIYTDGAYSPSRDQGGIGIVFVSNDEVIMKYNKMYSNTTNNQMEMKAVILALKSLKKPFDSVTIYTDSQYVINCALGKWQRKKNILLWKVFDKIYQEALKIHGSIKFQWVKGHNDNPYNCIADKIAVQASQE